MQMGLNTGAMVSHGLQRLVKSCIPLDYPQKQDERYGLENALTEDADVSGNLPSGLC